MGRGVTRQGRLASRAEMVQHTAEPLHQGSTAIAAGIGIVR